MAKEARDEQPGVERAVAVRETRDGADAVLLVVSVSAVLPSLSFIIHISIICM